VDGGMGTEGMRRRITGWVGMVGVGGERRRGERQLRAKKRLWGKHTRTLRGDFRQASVSEPPYQPNQPPEREREERERERERESERARERERERETEGRTEGRQEGRMEGWKERVSDRERERE